MPPAFFTIGVYGKNKDEFFGTLTNAGIDTFCDTRRRRGLRGSLYSFANSAALQSELARLGISYTHRLEVAPSDEIRKAQYDEDELLGVGKRDRQELSEMFRRRYRDEVLAGFDAHGFADSFGPKANRVVLFCVEAAASACHRSLLAARLEHDLKIRVTHL